MDRISLKGMKPERVYSSGEYAREYTQVVRDSFLNDDYSGNYMILRLARLASGFSFRDVSKELGIYSSSYFSYEKGLSYPRKSVRKRICDFYVRNGIFIMEEDVFPPEAIRRGDKRSHGDSVPSVGTVSLERIGLSRLPVYYMEDSVRPARNEVIRERLLEALSRMSVKQRYAVMLHRGVGFEETAYADVGRILGCSKQYVKEMEKLAFERIRRTRPGMELRKMLEDF